MKKIIIVGGGTGGTILANNLARRLAPEIASGAARVTLLTASDKHMYQPGLLYVAFGRMAANELYRDLRSLLEPGIVLHVDPVQSFDLDNNRLQTESGTTHDYDYLVICTGSRPNPESIPGLAENANHVYTLEAAEKTFSSLQAFTGGRVVVTTGVPHKCPMVPLELTFMMHDYFRDRGILDQVEFFYTYPIGRLHSLENVGKWAQKEFDRLGVNYETLFNLKQVDGDKGQIHSEEGSVLDYDLLVSIPPHTGMPLILDNALGAGGWIPTNPATLQMEGRENVFVLGDTTNIPISKAGSTAHYEAETLGENLSSLIRYGTLASLYSGKVFCFIEAGKDRATYASFDYKHPPQPQPPTQMIHWFKLAYNKLYWNSVRGLL